MEEGCVDMDEVEIREEPIALYKLLKLGNLVASGGEAKYIVDQGLVTVNGAVETKKGKKIFSGDIIEFQGERIQVVARGLTPS
jgi:ribosome-associated protein